MLANNNIVKQFAMKGKKQKKKEQPQTQVISNKQQQPQLHNIKFNISQDNLACFVGEKKNIKKKTQKPSSSPIKIKTLTKIQKEQKQLQLTKIEAPICSVMNELEQIIQGSSNAILFEIQNKGIDFVWEQEVQQPTVQSYQSDSSESSQLWSTFSVNNSFNDPLQKSYASTIDVQPIVNYYNETSYNPQAYYYNYNYITYQGNSFTVEPQIIKADPRTTVMIRNIPNKYTIKELAEEIDQIVPNSYDFLYLPCDIKNQCNVGYGFINFISNHYLHEFYQYFQGKRWLRFKSQKICNITYARLQGLDSLIEHFQNSKVQKDKKYRPIIREFESIGHLVQSQQLQ